MPQIIQGIQSQSAGPFAQNLLNQAGDARGARIEIMLQKKQQLFGQLDRIRREREISKAEDKASGISAGQIGTLAGAVIAAPFTGGMSLGAALAVIGGGSAIGGGIGGLFDSGASVQTSISNITGGAATIDSTLSKYYKPPQLGTPQG